MIPKDAKEKSASKGNEQMVALMEQITQTMRDLQEQVDDLREKKDSDGGARKLIADNLYNTPLERLREYSNISNSAVDPFSLAGTCGAVLDPKVLSGELSLCQIYLANILTYRRAVGGQLARFAAEQAKEEAQKATDGIDAEEGRIKGL